MVTIVGQPGAAGEAVVDGVTADGAVVDGVVADAVAADEAVAEVATPDPVADAVPDTPSDTPSAPPASAIPEPPTPAVDPWAVPDPADVGAYRTAARYVPRYPSVPWRTNGYAIAALAASLTCVLWPLAVGFATTALVQLRRRQQRGRALAVVSLVLGLLGLCLTATGGVVALRVGERIAHSRNYYDLRAGQCFVQSSGYPRERYPLVPCEQPHYGEVVGLATLSEADFPGADQVYLEAGPACRKATDAYAADSWAEPLSLVDTYFVPEDQVSWDQEPHRAVCFARTRSALGSGSIRLDASNLTADQTAYLAALLYLDRGVRPAGDPAPSVEALRSWAKDQAYGVQYAQEQLGERIWPAAEAAPVAALQAALKAELPYWQAAMADNQSTGELTGRLALAQEHSSVEQQKAVRAALGLRTDRRG